MNKLAWIAVIVVAAAGCAQDNTALERKLDKLSTQLASIEQRLATGTRAQPAPQRPRRPEPEASMVFAVPVDGLPTTGAADALVTIVEGYEYACPACNSARQTISQTLAKYGDKVRVVYKPYIVHPDIAVDSSLAACAAHRQGKFAAMDALLWEKAFGMRDFTAGNVEALAKEAGLDMKRYGADVAACRDDVKRQHAELQGFGQGATPTFFVNGRYVVGAQPEKLHAVVDQELALAQQRIKAGTPVRDYYKTWVLAKGLKRFTPPAPSAQPAQPVPPKSPST